MDGLTERVAAKLIARLDDFQLLDVQSRLAAACRARPGCSQHIVLAERDRTGASPVPVVNGMDVDGAGHFSGPHPSAWLRLLFGTPLYSASLDGHEALNEELTSLFTAERAAAASSTIAKSLVGNGWRTDDQLLQRRDLSAFRRLHRGLLTHAESMVRYSQMDSFEPRLQLRGWAVWLDSGGSMREHVHPSSSYSGVYYVSVPQGMRGGCLRLQDPRPGAQMVVLGAEDRQFMESRLLCPEPGLLVLFPSWVPHSVTPVEEPLENGNTTTRAPRIAVAFNVVYS